VISSLTGVLIVLKRPPGCRRIPAPGLAELLTKGIESARLRFTADASVALRNIEVLWIAYDTPVNANDIGDVDYVLEQIERALDELPRGATVLISSQLPVGSVRRLEAIAEGRFPDKSIGFAYSPENLRLGKALEVFLKPDRIVAGVRSSRDKERLERLFSSITHRIEWMSVESAACFPPFKMFKRGTGSTWLSTPPR